MSNYADHPDYQSQLRGIIAMPEDDVRRLVLADWLDENGDPTHARMIRFQCAPYPPHTGDCGGAMGDWSSGCEGCRIDGQIATLLLAGADHAGGGLKGRWELLFAPHAAGVFSNDPPNGWQPERPRHGRGCDVWATVRRGFIHTVTCTLSDWIGRHCPRCSGEGCSPHGIADNGSCIDTVKGIGPAVVAAHPVVTVLLTDVRPHRHLTVNQGERFGFELADDNARDDWQLPACLFNELPPGDWIINRNRRWWGGVQEAESHLSAACLAWAVKERDRNAKEEDQSSRQQVPQTHGG